MEYGLVYDGLIEKYSESRLMNFLRKLLFPFSLLYSLVTAIRNWLFDKGWFKSYSFEVPVIVVGNLSVGGTGKTPQIEYLVRLLAPHYKVATLSRGYKRKSEGFVLASSTSNAEELGDEPFQMAQKFPELIVAVDANRKNGIEQLLNLPVAPQVILLDDAFQHRKVKAKMYILLTTYSELYCEDYVLPTGNLRESSRGAQRANVIIVTKCPRDLSQAEQQRIQKKIGINRPVFFSYIDYDAVIYSKEDTKEVSAIHSLPKLLVAGIAKPAPFFSYLDSGRDERLEYPDHHFFTDNDIKTIQQKAKDGLIITTEKDYVRLKDQGLKSLYYLPIKSSFINGKDDFDRIVMSWCD